MQMTSKSNYGATITSENIVFIFASTNPFKDDSPKTNFLRSKTSYMQQDSQQTMTRKTVQKTSKKLM